MRVLLCSVLMWFSLLASAETAPVSDQLEQLKQQVIQLNRELFLLEEELLFPPQTQLAVFLSADTGQFFQLDSVELILNDKPVGAHLYTAQQWDALKRGAIQPLYKGNVKAGEHNLTAVFVGKGPDNRDYRRAVNYRFAKADDAVLLELQINDRSSDYQPDFVVQPWSND
ncbi:AraC family transcriptional regulator [Rheinheimera aquimaris]|uniref:AraC family transcriptional regulator n=1 Tax=Rheinheimera aquimaris TaxID=412437 RepID=A0ABN1DV03_9GAMM|nr:AraC family transcriptional regulator [Rheinheimera aquimaris]MCB5214012.1 AraC family transcriptional regulator [Rheinheimera aquimaris]MCD1597778.1 AraC family transcriptional regulator [Rheinheimera aquimaris]